MGLTKVPGLMSSFFPVFRLWTGMVGVLPCFFTPTGRWSVTPILLPSGVWEGVKEAEVEGVDVLHLRAVADCLL